MARTKRQVKAAVRGGRLRVKNAFPWTNRKRRRPHRGGSKGGWAPGRF